MRPSAKVMPPAAVATTTTTTTPDHSPMAIPIRPGVIMSLNYDERETLATDARDKPSSAYTLALLQLPVDTLTPGETRLTLPYRGVKHQQAQNNAAPPSEVSTSLTDYELERGGGQKLSHTKHIVHGYDAVAQQPAPRYLPRKTRRGTRGNNARPPREPEHVPPLQAIPIFSSPAAPIPNHPNEGHGQQNQHDWHQQHLSSLPRLPQTPVSPVVMPPHGTLPQHASFTELQSTSSRQQQQQQQPPRRQSDEDAVSFWQQQQQQSDEHGLPSLAELQIKVEEAEREYTQCADRMLELDVSMRRLSRDMFQRAAIDRNSR